MADCAASDALKEILPSGVATAALVGPGDPAFLLGSEREILARAAPKRIFEFAAGRQCARRAISKFGLPDKPIGMSADRRPRWPYPLTGSITHTDGFSAAAVAERHRIRAIGIDAERIGRVSSDIWGQMLVPAERSWLHARPDTERDSLATLLFSAKEAFYKCQYAITGQWLEFTDVSVHLIGRDTGWGSFAVRPARTVRLFARGDGIARGAFAVVGDLVLTAIAIAAH